MVGGRSCVVELVAAVRLHGAQFLLDDATEQPEFLDSYLFAYGVVLFPDNSMRWQYSLSLHTGLYYNSLFLDIPAVNLPNLSGQTFGWQDVLCDR